MTGPRFPPPDPLPSGGSPSRSPAAQHGASGSPSSTPSAAGPRVPVPSAERASAPLDSARHQLREMEAWGLSPQEQQKAREFRDHLVECRPELGEADRSFAALWVADRVGGASLQAQRPERGDENPTLLFHYAENVLKKSPEFPFGGADVMNEIGRAVQTGQRWREESFPAHHPEDVHLLDDLDPTSWSSLIDNFVCPTWGNSSIRNADDQRLELQKRWGVAPKNVPIPFTLSTGGPQSHRIYVVVGGTPSAPTLEIWNVGWGAFPAAWSAEALRGAPGALEKRETPLVYPMARFTFPDAASAGRALEGLRVAEARCMKNMSIEALLASLTLSSLRMGIRSTTLVAQAKTEGKLSFPLPPVKGQRSGSCVAKSLRVWVKEILHQKAASTPQLGEQAAREWMAVLDGCATALLASPPVAAPASAGPSAASAGPSEGAPPFGEVEQLQQMLARFQADYRWLQSHREKISPLERQVRTATLAFEYPSAQFSTKAELSDYTQTVRPYALAQEGVSHQPPDNPEAHLVAFCDTMIQALQDPSRLAELFANSPLMNQRVGVKSDLDLRWKECCGGKRPLSGRLLEYVTLQHLLTLWKVSEDARPFSCHSSMVESAATLRRLFTGLVSFLERPGQAQDWQRVDPLFESIPGPRATEQPLPTSGQELLTEARECQTDLLDRFKEWLSNQNLMARLGLTLKCPQAYDAYVLVMDALSASHSAKPSLTEEQKQELELWKTLANLGREIQERIQRGPCDPHFRCRKRASGLRDRTNLMQWESTASFGLVQSGLERSLQVRSLMNGLSMETPGLAALVCRSCEQRDPFAFAQQCGSWTRPLDPGSPEGQSSPVPQVQTQGNLVTLAGHAAWSRWLDTAIEQAGSIIGDTAGFNTAQSLGYLALTIVAGLPLFPTDEERQILRKWESLLIQLLNQHPQEAAVPLLLVRLALLPYPATPEQLSAKAVLGPAAIPFALHYRESDWGLLEKRVSHWQELLAAAGLPPESIEFEGPDRKRLVWDLSTGILHGAVKPSDADRELANMEIPPGWSRGIDGQGQISLQTETAQPAIRLTPEGRFLRVHWSSPISGGPESALLWDAENFHTVPIPIWKFPISKVSGPPPIGPNTPFPLPSGAQLLDVRGDLNRISPEGLKQRFDKLPGIFKKSLLYVERTGSRSYGLCSPGTLQETVRLLQSREGDHLLFPDGETIPLNKQWGVQGCWAIGNDSQNRYMLRDLSVRQQPLRGSLITEDGQEHLELDNGWRIAPAARARLPEWLQKLPSGSGDPPRAIALPVVRGQSLGLLIGSPRSSSAQGLGEALLVRVLESDDIELDSETDFRSVIALLPHLLAWAPLVAQRLLQAALRCPDLLSPQERIDLLEQVKQSLAEGAGLLLQPLMRELTDQQTGPASLLRGDTGAAHALAPVAGPYPSIRPLPPLQEEGAASGESASAFLTPLPEQLLHNLRSARENQDSGQMREALEHLDAVLEDRLHQQQTALTQIIQELPREEKALLLAGPGDLLIPVLLHTWFRAEQAHSLEAWRDQFGALSPDTVALLHNRIRDIASLQLQHKMTTSLLALCQTPDSIDWDRVTPLLNSLESRATERLPTALIREEWLFGLVARPTQTQLLESWARSATTPHSRQLHEVRMGGGKTSLLNPVIALEMAQQAKQADPLHPQPVLVVVPDNLEEDARQLCAHQGWQLMGQALPMVGSQENLKGVLEAASSAALQGVPLTLTQSAWNFAWLEALNRTLEGRTSVLSDQRPAAHDLNELRRAALLLDEADEVLSLNQSFNLQTAAEQPLPRHLLKTLEWWMRARVEAQQPLHSSLTEPEKREWLIAMAPAEWFPQRKEEVADRVLQKLGLEEDMGSDTREMADAALLLSVFETAAQLNWAEHYGPSTASSLDLVPYQSAHWPSDQKFSHPGVLALLTLFQAQQPGFWTAARAKTLTDLLMKIGQEDESLLQHLSTLGLSADIRLDPNKTADLLKSPHQEPLRAEIGLLLCKGMARTSNRSLSLMASGSPLRGQSCIAMTGTAPPPAVTPTVLDQPAAAPSASSSLLAQASLCEASSWDQILEEQSPDILIDPNGLLDAKEAAQLSVRMSQLAESRLGKRPLALSWTAGTAHSAPRLCSLLPSGEEGPAPSAETLASRSKCAVYQQAQCRGSDLKPGPGEKGVLFLKEPIPLRDLHQAAARLRGLVPSAPDQAPLQTLAIALEPSLMERVKRKQREGQDQGSPLTPIQALEQLCQLEEDQQNSRLGPELLRQDIRGFQQSLLIGLLCCQPLVPPEQATALQELLKRLEPSVQLEFAYPTLQELASADPRAAQATTRQTLQEQRDLLANILEQLQPLVDEASAEVQQQLAPLLAQIPLWLERWDQRLQHLSDPEEVLDLSPTAPLAAPLVTQGAVVRSVEGVAKEQESHQEIKAEVDRAIQLLSSMGKTGRRDHGLSLLVKAQVNASGTLEGVENRRATLLQVGIQGFAQYWQKLGGTPMETTLIPEEIAWSPWALQPYGEDLNLEDPLRLEPVVLHLRSPSPSPAGEAAASSASESAWSTAVVGPQEAAAMLETPQWAELSREGHLVLTTLAGTPFIGCWAPSPEALAQIESLPSQPAWQAHERLLAQQLAPLRSLFGVPLAVDPQIRSIQLEWLHQNPLWADTWLALSPEALRAARISQLSSVRVAPERHS